MRILFLSDQYPPRVFDGSGAYVADITRALAVRGHEVHVLQYWWHQAPGDERDGDVVVHRCRPLRLRGRWLFERSAMLRSARRALEGLAQGPYSPRDSVLPRLNVPLSLFLAYRRLGLSFDVVEAPEFNAPGLAFALTGVVPLVAFLHTPPMLDVRLRDIPLGWRGAVADALDQQAVLRADLRTSPSTILVDELEERGWMKGRDCLVVPYPCAAGDAGVPPTETGPVVLAVGRLEWRKGFDTLLEAAANLGPEVPELEVVIAGSSSERRGGRPYGEWMAGRALELGVRCRMSGFVDHAELNRLYAEARVTAVPSHFESFSIVGLEAMAAGRPVVCTSTTGLAEHALRAGAGSVVPPDDPGALADALLPYLLDARLATEHGAAGRAYVTTRLSPDAIAAEREDAYDQAIERHRRRRSSRRVSRPFMPWSPGGW